MCKLAGNANSYKDYSVQDDDTINPGWRIGNMGVFTLIVFVAAIIMGMICCCSCYYNYKEYKTGIAPFRPPVVCP